MFNCMSVFPRDISKTNAARITKHDIEISCHSLSQNSSFIVVVLSAIGSFHCYENINQSYLPTFKTSLLYVHPGAVSKLVSV